MDLCLLEAGNSLLKIKESQILPYLEKTGPHCLPLPMLSFRVSGRALIMKNKSGF